MKSTYTLFILLYAFGCLSAIEPFEITKSARTMIESLGIITLELSTTAFRSRNQKFVIVFTSEKGKENQQNNNTNYGLIYIFKDDKISQETIVAEVDIFHKNEGIMNIVIPSEFDDRLLCVNQNQLPSTVGMSTKGSFSAIMRFRSYYKYDTIFFQNNCWQQQFFNSQDKASNSQKIILPTDYTTPISEAITRSVLPYQIKIDDIITQTSHNS